MKANRYILAATALLSMTTISAQTMLSVDQCREMALQHNLKLDAARMQVDQASAMVKSYRANYYPDFSASFQGLYSTANGTYKIDGGNLPVLSVGADGSIVQTAQVAYFPGLEFDYKINGVFRGGVEVTQPIYMGGKIRASVAMATGSRDLAQYNRDKVSVEVVVEATRAYANVVKALKMLDVANAYRNVIDGLQSDVTSAVNHGMRHRNDLMKVSVRGNEADLNILKAQNAVRLAKMDLCRAIGLPLMSNIDVVASFPEVDVPEAVDETTAVMNRPESKMLDARQEVLEQKVKLSRSEMLPSVGLAAGYHYLSGLKLNNDRLFDGGSFGVMLNVKIPLFHFGEHSQKVKADKASLQQAKYESEHSRQMMELEMRSAYSNLQEADAAFTMTKTALEQATENMRLSKSMFDNGMETLSDYLEAQVIWQQANEEHITAGFNRYVSYIDYQRTIGAL